MNLGVLLENGDVYICDKNHGAIMWDYRIGVENQVLKSKALSHLLKLTWKYGLYYGFVLHYSDCSIVNNNIQLGTLDRIEMLESWIG